MADEQEKQRVDRELIELLNELRVVLPGVQVLFAFLLVLPFQAGFKDTTDRQRVVYLVDLLLTALAAALLIAPSVYHRLNFRRRDKERLLFDANRLLIAGTVATGLGIACSIFLVVSFVFGEPISGLATLGTVVVFGVLWFGLPLRRRAEPDR